MDACLHLKLGSDLCENSPKRLSDDSQNLFFDTEKRNSQHNCQNFRIKKFLFADFARFWTTYGRTDIAISSGVGFCFRLACLCDQKSAPARSSPARTTRPGPAWPGPARRRPTVWWGWTLAAPMAMLAAWSLTTDAMVARRRHFQLPRRCEREV